MHQQRQPPFERAPNMTLPPMATYRSNPQPAESWLIRMRGTWPAMRLYCFSHAGGNASDFLPWRKLFDASFEICAIALPGRGARRSEHPRHQLTELAGELAQAISAETSIPFAFFGHSLGALLAFETARYCQQHALPTPLHVFASGCPAPQHRNPARGISNLPTDELIAVLRGYNRTPPEVLANAELMDMVLPAIRADFAMAEQYAYLPAPALRMPVTVLAGASDHAMSAAQAQGWAKETSAECRIRWYDGGHFFLDQHLPAVARCILSDLGTVAPG